MATGGGIWVAIGALKATQTRHYFAMVYFFAELAMTNPVFQKAQRELTEYYQASLVLKSTEFSSHLHAGRCA